MKNPIALCLIETDYILQNPINLTSVTKSASQFPLDSLRFCTSRFSFPVHAFDKKHHSLHKKMAPPTVWNFSCDHQFTITKYVPNKRGFWQGAPSTAVIRTVPNQCPECFWAVQEAKRKEKELLAQDEAALLAHKEHGKFLQTQLAKSAGDPALNEVFKKLFEDCVFHQAEKVVKILLAQDKNISRPDSDRIHMIKAAAENLKILESAAQIQWKRKAAQNDIPPDETERHLSKLNFWIALNRSISARFPNSDHEVGTIWPSYHQDTLEAGRFWTSAVNLAKCMDLDR